MKQETEMKNVSRENNFVLGIDPGFTGALVLYDPSRKQLQAVKDMPVRKLNQAKIEIDGFSLAQWLGLHAIDIRFAIIEKVHSMPGQSAPATFRFGEGYGMILGILNAFCIPTHKADPAAWKLGMNLSKDKNLSRAKATDLFPLSHLCFAKAKDDGKAEAALLAVWGSLYVEH